MIEKGKKEFGKQPLFCTIIDKKNKKAMIYIMNLQMRIIKI
jgi:hypothetical protein